MKFKSHSAHLFLPLRSWNRQVEFVMVLHGTNESNQWLDELMQCCPTSDNLQLNDLQVQQPDNNLPNFGIHLSNMMAVDEWQKPLVGS